MAESIEIIYLKFPVHPNITVIQTGPGIEKIVREGSSYFVWGTDDGPLAAKKVEIPADNIAAVQWALEEGTPPLGDDDKPAAAPAKTE